MLFRSISSDGYDLLSARQERATEIESQKDKVAIGKDTTEYDRRIANLIGGISVIEVGGNSEIEVKDTKLRIEDALNSVKAAREEGIVAGGGYSFIQVVNHIMKEYDGVSMSKDKSVALDIITEALKSVTKQIAINSGVNGEDVVVSCIAQNKGYNALTEKYTDLVEDGVINAVKVDRYCILNAVSVAGTVLTMGGAIVEENEKDQNMLQLVTQGVPVI